MQETQETWVQSLGWEDPLEEEMATHSWKIPWTEEPGGLQSRGRKELDATEPHPCNLTPTIDLQAPSSETLAYSLTRVPSMHFCAATSLHTYAYPFLSRE